LDSIVGVGTIRSVQEKRERPKKSTPAPKRGAGPKAKIRAMAPAQRYDANIDHILRAAAEVFAEKSFGLASIRDIAAHARISFPRIYYYLRNKEELLFLISSRAFEKLSARAQEPEEKLRRFIKVHIEYQLDNVAEMKVLVRETQSLSPRNAAQIARMMREYSKVCRKLIEQVAASAGASIDRETSRIQTSLLFGAMNSVFAWYELSRDREQQDRIVEEVYKMAVSAITSRRSPAQ
jgi:AcrR family transcriptional regulator